MVEVEFLYKEQNIIFNCDLDSKLKSIFKNFEKYAKIDDDVVNIYYFYDGNEILNDESSVEDIINFEDSESGKMSIKVKIEKKQKEEKINYKNIICPECKENIKLDIKNYKINLYECKNNHKIENILLNELKESQNLNKIDKLCDICKKNNKEISDDDNKFVKCLTCNKYLCSLCKSYHDLTHDLIDFEETFYLCDKHNKNYNSYCEICKINLCESCEHNLNHKKINYKNILPKKDTILEEKFKLKKLIHLFNTDINMLISMLNEVKNKINIYYQINEDIINNYKEKTTNYETLYFLNKFPNKNIIEDLEKVVNYNTVIDKFYDIFTLYKKMNNDEITLIYKVKDKKEVNLFNKGFVRNYKNYCKLIIEGKEKDLKDVYIFGKFFATNKDTLEVKLKGITNITNMNSMLCSCKDLISLPDFHKWNTTTVTQMNNLFNNCSLLESLPDISKWNTSIVTNMSCMFSDCFKLKNLPEISEWDTSNVIDMSHMFQYCYALSSLPNISKWNISNLLFMDKMFLECIGLRSFPSKFKKEE